MTTETAPRSSGDYRPGEVGRLRFHSATARFAEGEDSPRDYLERCLRTLHEREPIVRAWVVLNEQGAREQADASAERWRRGRPLSPIDGMPIGVKDLLETRDMPTQMGCAAFAGNFPKRDNAAVSALRQAGAVILGKTVTTELGGPEPGPTTNPFDPARTPGGSSSGSAAAVAAGMVPAAIATQVGGSLMRPASFCGNWGLKPTQGAINRGERQATSMSAHGVLANCPEDVWLVSIAIASRAGGDPGRRALSGPDQTPGARRPLTLAVMETEGWDRLDDASRAAFEAVIERVEADGVNVLRRQQSVEIERLEQALEGATELTNTMTAWENHWLVAQIVAGDPDSVTPRGRSFTLATAERLGAAGYDELLERRAVVRRVFTSLAPAVDAVIAPSSPGPAPVWSGDAPDQPPAKWPTGDPVFNIPSSLLGAPAVNLPLLSVEGLPMGVQLMGQPDTDARVLAFARWLWSIAGR